MIRRLPDWPELLAAYIEQVRHRRFDMAGFNCGQYAGGAVKAITGADPLKDLGLTFDSDRDFAKVVGDARALAEVYFGGPPRPPLQARRGDVVIMPGVDGETLGVCVGDHALILVEDGLQREELAHCSGCWWVGK